MTIESRTEKYTRYTVYSWSPYGSETYYEEIFNTLKEAEEFASRINDKLIVITKEVTTVEETEIIYKDEDGQYSND